MKKALSLTVAVIIFLIAGFYAVNAYIYSAKQGDPMDIQSYRGTLTGQVVCLPPKDKDGPNTRECAMGLRTDAGEHYALDFAMMSQENPGIDSGDRFTANGLITPVEMLSAERWSKYDMVGIFSVTDSVRKL